MWGAEFWVLDRRSRDVQILERLFWYPLRRLTALSSIGDCNKVPAEVEVGAEEMHPAEDI